MAVGTDPRTNTPINRPLFPRDERHWRTIEEERQRRIDDKAKNPTGKPRISHDGVVRYPGGRTPPDPTATRRANARKQQLCAELCGKTRTGDALRKCLAQCAQKFPTNFARSYANTFDDV